MRRKFLITMVMVFLLLFPTLAAADELMNLQAIREQPVNVFDLGKKTVDLGGVIVAKFLGTTNPVALYRDKHGLGAAEITLVEGFLHPKLNLTGGVTLKNKEPSHVLFGLELHLKLKGDLGRLLSKFHPGIYWADERWWFGISLALRGLSTQPVD